MHAQRPMTLMLMASDGECIASARNFFGCAQKMINSHFSMHSQRPMKLVLMASDGECIASARKFFLLCSKNDKLSFFNALPEAHDASADGQ